MAHHTYVQLSLFKLNKTFLFCQKLWGVLLLYYPFNCFCTLIGTGTGTSNRYLQTQKQFRSILIILIYFFIINQRLVCSLLSCHSVPSCVIDFMCSKKRRMLVFCLKLSMKKCVEQQSRNTATIYLKSQRCKRQVSHAFEFT